MRVSIRPELEAEIRAAMHQDDCGHVPLPGQILVLVRQGLHYQKLIRPMRDRAVEECALEEFQLDLAPGQECQILAFPKRE